MSNYNPNDPNSPANPFNPANPNSPVHQAHVENTENPNSPRAKRQRTVKQSTAPKPAVQSTYAEKQMINAVNAYNSMPLSQAKMEFGLQNKVISQSQYDAGVRVVQYNAAVETYNKLPTAKAKLEYAKEYGFITVPEYNDIIQKQSSERATFAALTPRAKIEYLKEKGQLTETEYKNEIEKLREFNAKVQNTNTRNEAIGGYNTKIETFNSMPFSKEKVDYGFSNGLIDQRQREEYLTYFDNLKVIDDLESANVIKEESLSDNKKQYTLIKDVNSLSEGERYKLLNLGFNLPKASTPTAEQPPKNNLLIEIPLVLNSLISGRMSYDESKMFRDVVEQLSSSTENYLAQQGENLKTQMTRTDLPILSRFGNLLAYDIAQLGVGFVGGTTFIVRPKAWEETIGLIDAENRAVLGKYISENPVEFGIRTIGALAGGHLAGKAIKSVMPQTEAKVDVMMDIKETPEGFKAVSKTKGVPNTVGEILKAENPPLTGEEYVVGITGERIPVIRQYGNALAELQKGNKLSEVAFKNAVLDTLPAEQRALLIMRGGEIAELSAEELRDLMVKELGVDSPWKIVEGKLTYSKAGTIAETPLENVASMKIMGMIREDLTPEQGTLFANLKESVPSDLPFTSLNKTFGYQAPDIVAKLNTVNNSLIDSGISQELSTQLIQEMSGATPIAAVKLAEGAGLTDAQIQLVAFSALAVGKDAGQLTATIEEQGFSTKDAGGVLSILANPDPENIANTLPTLTTQALSPVLETMEPSLLGKVLDKLSSNELVVFVPKLSNDSLNAILPDLSSSQLAKIIPAMSHEQIVDVIPKLDSDTFEKVAPAMDTEQIASVVKDLSRTQIATLREVIGEKAFLDIMIEPAAMVARLKPGLGVNGNFINSRLADKKSKKPDNYVVTFDYHKSSETLHTVANNFHQALAQTIVIRTNKSYIVECSISKR